MTYAPVSATDTSYGGGGDSWRPLPEGLWRFVVGRPSLVIRAPHPQAKNPDWPNYRIQFPLMLAEAEQDRLKSERGEPGDGEQQSYRCSYFCGAPQRLLGYVDREGNYHASGPNALNVALPIFLVSCLGTVAGREARDAIKAGFVPPLGGETPEAYGTALLQWLCWLENLELYGTVTQQADRVTPEKIWSNFGGPMAIGSLPGQPEKEYQARSRGKWRAMQADDGSAFQLLPELGYNARGERSIVLRDGAPGTAAQGVAEGAAVAATAPPVQQKSAVAATSATAAYTEIFGEDDA